MDVWQTPMMMEFDEVVKTLGVTFTTVKVVDEATKEEHFWTVSENFGIKDLMEERMDQPSAITTSLKCNGREAEKVNDNGNANPQDWPPPWPGSLRES